MKNSMISGAPAHLLACIVAGLLTFHGSIASGQASPLPDNRNRPAASYGTMEEEKPWQELVPDLPPFPQEENLVEFYVSAVTPNRFFVDTNSVAVGADGIVRYALVVKTSGGATNVTFEGLRCKGQEMKIYATGHADKTWAPARSPEWRRFASQDVNRQHAALSRDLFCPQGSPIFTADEGRNALRRGKHPNAN